MCCFSFFIDAFICIWSKEISNHQYMWAHLCVCKMLYPRAKRRLTPAWKFKSIENDLLFYLSRMRSLTLMNLATTLKWPQVDLRRVACVKMVHPKKRDHHFLHETQLPTFFFGICSFSAGISPGSSGWMLFPKAWKKRTAARWKCAKSDTGVPLARLGLLDVDHSIVLPKQMVGSAFVF